MVMVGSKVEISKETHKKLKVFCAQRDLKLGAYVDWLVCRGIENEEWDRADKDNKQETESLRDLRG